MIKAAKKNIGIDNIVFYDSMEYDVYENLPQEQKEEIELNEAKSVSRGLCKERNINISEIASDELEKMGFKKDIPTFIFSKLIEDVYHERSMFNASDYYNLSIAENEHYTRLVNEYKIGSEKMYISLIAKAISESNAESKNINDIVYGIVKKISIKIDNSLKLQLGA